MEDIDYTKETEKTFDEAVDAVVEETEKVGFKVLHIHDVKATIAKKGFEIEPLKIVEICSAKHAHTVIQKDIRLALCLPCKINVYVKDSTTYISGMRPVMLKEIFPEIDLGDLPQVVDEIIRKIVDRARR